MNWSESTILRMTSTRESVEEKQSKRPEQDTLMSTWGRGMTWRAYSLHRNPLCRVQGIDTGSGICSKNTRVI